jgi:probable rRNA maturation factor
VTLIVDVASEGVRAPVSRARLRDVALAVLEAERVRDALVSIALVTAPRIARLNREHLRHTGETDVISFALEPGGRRAKRVPIVGDIYIAPAVARANARRFGGSVREELERLVIHGTLHVLGYDHPDGAARTASRLWGRQEQLLAAGRETSMARTRHGGAPSAADQIRRGRT